MYPDFCFSMHLSLIRKASAFVFRIAQKTNAHLLRSLVLAEIVVCISGIYVYRVDLGLLCAVCY